MKRVLFVQPSLQPPGGGNGVAAWMLDALRGHYQLATCTWSPLDVDAINRYYGTTLSADEIERFEVPALVRRLVEPWPVPLALLRMSILMRFARRFVREFDVVVSAHNETDVGRLSVQYIHYPTFIRPRPTVDIRWYHPSWALELYYRLCDRISTVSEHRLSSNLTLANSDWTKAHFAAAHGGDPRTVYPPVTGTFPRVGWTDRRGDFVCVGRLSPEKDLDAVIDIVAAVRKVHPDTRLHIIGSRGPWRYTRRILRRVANNRDWITLHLDVTHAEVRRLMSLNRYGLHAMPNEHFGMAPAEMATAGCIVWVRDDGGQVEIVDGESRLMFHSVDDAVARILRTMADPAEQQALRAHLAAVTPRFSGDRFAAAVRAAVAEQLARDEAAAASDQRQTQ